MEFLQMVLGILVSVGAILIYMRSAVSTAVHAVVDRMFAEQAATVNRMFADQQLAIERQTQTLDMLDKTITKMNAIIDKVSDHQYDMDKELAGLSKDVKALHKRVDRHDTRIERFCEFCNREHKGDMPPELMSFIIGERVVEDE